MTQDGAPHLIRASITHSLAPAETLLGCRKAILKARSVAAQRLWRGRRLALSQRRARLAETERRGYLRGMERAHIELASRLAPILSLEKELIEAAHKDCLEIALSAARVVVEKLASTDSETIKRRINRALEKLIESRSVSVTLPEEKHLTETLNYSVKQDPSLRPGEILIQTSSGKVLLSAREEFDSVAELLRARLKFVLSSTTSSRGTR